MRLDNGQCAGCSYQSPNASAQASITIQFHSESHATVNWAGAAIPIRRFNFKFGDSYEQVLGEWLFVTGSPLFPVYFGERITFWGITVEQGDRFIHGHRTGANDQPAVALSPDFLRAYGFDMLVLFDSSPEYYTWYAWRRAGLNRIEGRLYVDKKSQADVSLQRLLIEGKGLPFIATRNALGTSNTAAARSVKPTSKESSPENSSLELNRSHIDEILYLQQSSPVNSAPISAANSEDTELFMEFADHMLTLIQEGQ